MNRTILLFLFITIHTFSQSKFTSNKYNYSFVIPDGWYEKEKIMNPDVDAKIVDGKGNSFIVSIKTFPTATRLTIKQQMAAVTNNELIEQFNWVYGTTQIAKRGVYQIDLKEFYYLHLLTPFQGDLKLYHKQFIYSYGNRVLSIDACSVEPFLDETTPAFAIMLDTFKFLNLKDKVVKK